MRCSARTIRRPAYTLVVVIVACFLVFTFAAVMSGLVALEWKRDRQAALETCACEAIASAQTWSDRHAAELLGGQAVTLPLEDLLPPATTGTLALHVMRSATGELLARCEVTLERAGRRLNRQALWPLPRGG